MKQFDANITSSGHSSFFFQTAVDGVTMSERLEFCQSLPHISHVGDIYSRIGIGGEVEWNVSVTNAAKYLNRYASN